MSESYLVVGNNAIEDNILSKNLFNEIEPRNSNKSLQINLLVRNLILLVFVLVVMMSSFFASVYIADSLELGFFANISFTVAVLAVVGFILIIALCSEAGTRAIIPSLEGYAKRHSESLKGFGIEVLNQHYKKQMVVDSVSVFTDRSSKKLDGNEIGINIYYREGSSDKCMLVILKAKNGFDQLKVSSYKILTASEE